MTKLKHCDTDSVQIKFTNSFTRLKDVFKFKDRQTKHLKSNVVYHILL